jgi:peptide/nickel transport system permease protein
MENTWKLLKSAPPTAIFGLVVIVVYVFVALFAPVLTPYGESEIVGSAYELWGEGFVLGTDNLGRDMLTRLIYGARNTIGIAFATTVLSFLIGGVLGLMATALGGWVDQLLGRIVDVLMAIPTLIFALLLLTILGTDMIVLILVIAVLDSTRVFRLARAVSMNIVVLDFVEAARLRGEGTIALLFRVSFHQFAQLPRPRPAAADGGLGQHGARQRDPDYLRRYYAAAAGGRYCVADRGSELRGRLVPA